AFEWKTEVSPIVVPDPVDRVDPFSGVQIIEIAEPKKSIPIPQIPKTPLADKVTVVDDDKKIEEAITVPSIDIPVDIDLGLIEVDIEVAPVRPFETSAEVMAVFDQKISFDAYIAKKFRLPANAAGISGKVIIQFIVDKDGSLTEVEILKGLSPKIDAEAVRVIKNSPKWKPARQGNRIVRLRMIQTIVIASPQE
ncbi:MAG: TonB family protein, partial [Bacteroidota bacterium]|nr:TonB family protein [Bacteroidota bacterium]